MLAQCAIKAEAEAIFTWSRRHHALCGPEVTGGFERPKSDFRYAYPHGSGLIGKKDWAPVSPTCMSKCPLWASRPPVPPGREVS